MGNIIGNSIEQHELRKENECLRTELAALQKKVSGNPAGSSPAKNTKRPASSSISSEALAQYIDSLMGDKATNIAFLPDFVERKIYTNVFAILLRLLDDTLDKSAISLLGHRVVFDVVEDENNTTDAADHILTFQQLKQDWGGKPEPDAC